MRRGRRTTQPTPTAPELREAGDLLAVEAIDPSGLIVTREGAFVRILHVTPPNPLILAPEDRERLATGFCYVAGRLSPGQSLQYYVQSRPIDVEDLLAASRREVEAWAGPPPTIAGEWRDARARDRWRPYAAMEESILLHAHAQAAIDFNAYVIVPFTPPRPNDARSMLASMRPGGRLPSSLLTRELPAHARVMRQAIAHADAIRAELESLGIATRQLDGAEAAALLFNRFNPTAADAGAQPPRHGVLAALDGAREPATAREGARELRARLACSAIDFAAASTHALVDRDAEQVVYAASTAESTYFGWPMLAMTTCPLPFTLSVHVHALDRRRERRRAKMAFRRTFAVNRHAESRGGVPDFDRYLVEQEQQQLLTEMAGHQRAAIYQLSLYQSIRAPGPEPDLALLKEATDNAIEQLSSAADCHVDPGRHQQSALWPSTLPLGRDAARRVRRYATRNVGDSTPLLGVSVGSPTGIPFAYSDPGRTLEKFNPYDSVHPNHLCLVTGRSGAGKTLLCNVLMARAIAHGARGFAIDRAGHYRVLTSLVDGAQHVDIGAEDSQFHLNPWDVEDPANVPREKVAFLIGLHETMIQEGLTTIERAQLGGAIRSAYERAAAEGLVPRESLLKEELEARAALEQHAGSPEVAFALRNLAERLSEFCGRGAYAHIADQPSTHLADTPLLVFDTRRCPDAVLRPVVFTVLEFITRTVERHFDEHRAMLAAPDAPLLAGRSFMLGDEFWSVLSNPALGGYANDLARRSRHLGLTLIVATQQLSDFDNEHGLALLRNSTIQIFLTQHREELAFVQRALGLSDAEVELIARLKTVKGAYSQALWVNGTRGRGQVSIRLGPTELWAFTSDQVSDAPMRDVKLAEHDGDAWRAIAELAGHLPPRSEAAEEARRADR
jgi:energy-coupling factor transporter ATP-binding protein EcfA2